MSERCKECLTADMSQFKHRFRSLLTGETQRSCGQFVWSLLAFARYSDRSRRLVAHDRGRPNQVLLYTIYYSVDILSQYQYQTFFFMDKTNTIPARIVVTGNVGISCCTSIVVHCIIHANNYNGPLQ